MGQQERASSPIRGVLPLERPTYLPFTLRNSFGLPRCPHTLSLGPRGAASTPRTSVLSQRRFSRSRPYRRSLSSFEHCNGPPSKVLGRLDLHPPVGPSLPGPLNVDKSLENLYLKQDLPAITLPLHSVAPIAFDYQFRF